MNSVQVDKAKGMNISKQEAVVGSINPGMETQEFGDTIGKKGRKGVAIPTTVSSGEGEGVKPRRKVVRRPNYRSNIKLRRLKNTARSKKQFIIATIKATAKRGARGIPKFFRKSAKFHLKRAGLL